MLPIIIIVNKTYGGIIMTKTSSLILLVTAALLFNSCEGAKPLTASKFVSNLNTLDNDNSTIFTHYDSELLKDVDQSKRSGWFVIWDDKHSENRAVRLEYIREKLNGAPKYREESDNDLTIGGILHDLLFGGNEADYEDVDYIGKDAFGQNIYEGQSSGLLYEDQEKTYDVSLLAGEAAYRKKVKKSARLSYLYQLDIKTSFALVSLGEKVEEKLGSGSGDITLADEIALMKNLSEVVGVSINELTQIEDIETQEQTLEKISKNIGVSMTSLREKIIPGIFGIDL